VNFFGYYNGLALLFELGRWTKRTPINATCAWCHEPIHRGENGVEFENGRCEHIECFIVSIVGSVAHQEHSCTCYDGFVDCEEDEIGKRETAKAAFQNWQKWGTSNKIIVKEITSECSKIFLPSPADRKRFRP
jgi:hypothetical protein